MERGFTRVGRIERGFRVLGIGWINKNKSEWNLDLRPQISIADLKTGPPSRDWNGLKKAEYLISLNGEREE